VAKDVVVEAIDDVSIAVQENVDDQEDLLSELARVRHERIEGVPLGEALGRERRPRVVVVLDRIVNRLTLGSARLRRAFITSLVEEGDTVTSVATRFEVTHQRISSILGRGRD
jgi:predicted RecB family endonuclease